MISRFSAIPIRIQGGIVWGNSQANSEIYHENKNGQKKNSRQPCRTRRDDLSYQVLIFLSIKTMESLEEGNLINWIIKNFINRNNKSTTQKGNIC